MDNYDIHTVHILTKRTAGAPSRPELSQWMPLNDLLEKLVRESNGYAVSWAWAFRMCVNIGLPTSVYVPPQLEKLIHEGGSTMVDDIHNAIVVTQKVTS